MRLARWAMVWALWAGAACAQREAPPGGASSSPPVWSSTTAPAGSLAPPAQEAASPGAIAGPHASASAAAADPDPNAPLRVIDLHVDTPYQIVQKGRAIQLDEGHATVEALQKGRYAGIVYPIYIADYLNNHRPRISDADRILATIDELVAHHDALVFERDGGGGEAGVTAYLAIEGAGAFAEDITQIDRFISRGVRLVGPVHAQDNKLASSATGKSGGATGLTELGRAFCRRVYEKGALVDVSHMSDAAFADLVPIAAEFGAPIVATHSNARAVADNPRNLTDAQLRTIAASGGVAGLNLHSAFVKAAPTATMQDVVAQTLHMVRVAGAAHVAIGSDFDGGRPPTDFADASYFPAFAERLIAAGLSRADVRAIFSENAARVLAFGRRGSRGEPQ